jgi:hypothetical protein
VIAPTFSAANQNSNSPKFFTAARFATQKTTMNRATQAHSGVPGSQPVTIFAAPMPSRPTAVQSSTQKDQPAVKPGPGPDRPLGVRRERARRRIRGRHLAEHPHHQHDEQTGDGVRDDDRRAGGGDAGAGTDEQARADHPAEGDHRQMALLEAVRERDIRVGRSGRSYRECRRSGSAGRGVVGGTGHGCGWSLACEGKNAHSLGGPSARAERPPTMWTASTRSARFRLRGYRRYVATDV